MNVVVNQVYAIKAICKYVCVYFSGLYIFDGDEYCV
jgi:hypothetical protein